MDRVGDGPMAPRADNNCTATSAQTPLIVAPIKTMARKLKDGKSSPIDRNDPAAAPSVLTP